MLETTFKVKELSPNMYSHCETLSEVFVKYEINSKFIIDFDHVM